MIKREIIDGIAAYDREQEIICRVLRRHWCGLHQDEFDRIFSFMKRTKAPEGAPYLWRDSFRSHHRIPFFCALTENTFILGVTASGMNGAWLELLQYMCAAGTVYQTGKKPNLIYHIT